MADEKLALCLWFEKDAEAAARFYCELFPDSEIVSINRSPTDWPGGKAGDVLTIDLTVNTLECWLADRKFVCGDRFTMADVYVGSQVDWGLQFGTLPERAAFKGYAERINARAAKQEANGIDMSLMEQTND